VFTRSDLSSLGIDMQDNLFVGTSKSADLDTVLQDACGLLIHLGIPTASGDLVALRVKKNSRTRTSGFLEIGSYLELLFKNAITYVTIAPFENEIVPGYSVIAEPFMIGIGVWVGAGAIHKALAACVAAAIATNAGTKIQDSEHLWSDREMNDPNEFMEKVRDKYVAEG
jgi:hypothetical protein